ncbi:MAG: sugar ABC transporter permease [Defluviitaleaceae bacterium]|nr:sugar ABC transporter permease [Defluviitaleaceae bacterium]
MENEKKPKRKGLSLRGRQTVSGYLFIAPWLIGITFFFLYNIIEAWRYSFNILVMEEGKRNFTWVGLDNYYFIFREHTTFFVEMFESIFQMVINVPLIIFFALFMAILLNRQFMGRGLVRAIFFLPVIMASAAIADTIEMSFGMIFGGVNFIPPEVMREQTGFNVGSIIMLLANFQIPPQVVEFIVEAIANLHEIIRSAGVQILIFLAALQSIPPSMYEVAQIEGATGYETFWKITIPMVSPLIITNVVYTVVDTYANSDVVETARDMYVMENNFGASSAMSLSTALLVCLVLFAICWLISRRVFYYD